MGASDSCFLLALELLGRAPVVDLASGLLELALLRPVFAVRLLGLTFLRAALSSFTRCLLELALLGRGASSSFFTRLPLKLVLRGRLDEEA